MRLAAILFAALALWAAPARAQLTPAYEALDPYALYQMDVTALLQAEIDSATALDTALERAARHDPERVARGWIAYGALAAAQSPAWVNGVRSRIRSAGRAAVLRQLRRDLTYARRRPPGADEATQLVLRAMAADVARMQAAAFRYEGVGDSVDARAWVRIDGATREQGLRRRDPRTLAPDFVVRLHVAPLSATPLSDPTAFGGARFWDSLANRASPTPPALPWRASSQATLDRMLTLGALIVADALQSEAARANAMLDDGAVRECLALQQLQFRQCASVAHDPNEDAFCLARHGLQEPSRCLTLAIPG